MYTSVYCRSLLSVELGALFLILSHPKRANFTMSSIGLNAYRHLEDELLLLLLLNLLNILSSYRVNLTVEINKQIMFSKIIILREMLLNYEC